MNRALFIGLSLKRTARDWAGLFFTVAMPVLMYLVFGAGQQWADHPAGDGNVAAYIMVSMALYGGASAAVGGAGFLAVERTTGWGRQLALTPLSTANELLTHAVQIAVRVALPVLAVNAAGAFTGAEMPLSTWLLSMLICVLVSMPFGFLGLDVAMLLPSESAVSIAAASVVLLAFASNMFMPLPDSLLPYARWTPLYGANVLTHFPMADGFQPTAAGGGDAESLTVAVVNIAAWLLLFAGICWVLSRREKGRA